MVGFFISILMSRYAPKIKNKLKLGGSYVQH